VEGFVFVDAAEELEIVVDVLMEEGLVDVLDVVFVNVPDEVLYDVPDEVPKDVPRDDFKDVFEELVSLVGVAWVAVELLPLDRF
jgi:hypothetical protein